MKRDKLRFVSRLEPVSRLGKKHDPLRDEQRAAVERLLRIAQYDTEQGRRVADFLLAWWNTSECGGFDPTEIWMVEEETAADMLTVFALIARCRLYPDTLGYARRFQALEEAWRS